MGINSVPTEIMNEVLGYLSPEDQSAVSCVNSTLNQTITTIFQHKMEELCTFIRDSDHQIAQMTKGNERLIAPQPRNILFLGMDLTYVASCVHPQMIQNMQLKATPLFYEACKESVVDALADCSFSDLEKIQSTGKLALQLLDEAKNTMKGSLSISIMMQPYTSNEHGMLFGVHVFNRESFDWSENSCTILASASFNQRLNPFFSATSITHLFPKYLPVSDKKEGDTFYLPQAEGVAKSTMRIKLVCDQMNSPIADERMLFEKAISLAKSFMI